MIKPPHIFKARRAPQGQWAGLIHDDGTGVDRDIETLRFYAEAAERPDADLPALLAAMAKMSRDQGRTPVQWDASPGAGFTTVINGAGKLEFEFTVPDNAAFFRVESL